MNNEHLQSTAQPNSSTNPNPNCYGVVSMHKLVCFIAIVFILEHIT